MTVTLLDRKEETLVPCIEYTIRVQTNTVERIFYINRHSHTGLYRVYDTDECRYHFPFHRWSKTISAAFIKRVTVIPCYRAEYRHRFGGISEEDLQILQEICAS